MKGDPGIECVFQAVMRVDPNGSRNRLSHYIPALSGSLPAIIGKSGSKHTKTPLLTIAH
jgi:hypothetical protein